MGNIQLEDVVVVSGCGPIGLGMVATARLKNPRKLIALDLLDWKVLIYSELPLIRTPEVRLPLYSGHFKMSFLVQNSPLK